MSLVAEVDVGIRSFLLLITQIDMLVQSCNAVLIYNSPKKEQRQHVLSENQAMIIGRDPSCQIALDPTLYQGVSRRHAELCPVVSVGKLTQWRIHDLNSTNGIFVNGHPLQEAQLLQNGDRITLGKHGLEFLFELQVDQTGSRSDSALLPDTVYEQNSEPIFHPTLSPRATLQLGFGVTEDIAKNAVKIIAGIVGVATIFCLNSAPTPQQVQNSATSPTSEPSSQQPPNIRLSDVEFQGLDLFTRYFDIVEGEVVEDVPYTTPSGQETTFDAYRFEVIAKSTFQESDVDFTIYFYDASGNVLSPSTQIYYASSPQNWTIGMKRVSVFLLPSDRSNLKVIQFSR